MHPLYHTADQLSHSAMGAAIEVHPLKGTRSDRELPLAGTEVCAGDFADPQGPTPQLHETPNIPIGLILSFHELKLAGRLVRMILPGANQ